MIAIFASTPTKDKVLSVLKTHCSYIVYILEYTLPIIEFLPRTITINITITITI